MHPAALHEPQPQPNPFFLILLILLITTAAAGIAMAAVIIISAIFISVTMPFSIESFILPLGFMLHKVVPFHKNNITKRRAKAV